MDNPTSIPPSRVLALFLTLLFSDATLASNREWYELTIDGSRVGYGWVEQSQEPKHRLYVESTRVDITQLRKTESIESVHEVMRDANGLPESIIVESTVGDHKTGWQGKFSGDARTLSIQVAGGEGKQTFNVSTDLILPDQLTMYLSSLGANAEQGLEIHYLEPSTAQPMALRALRLSPPGAPVNKVRTIESSKRGSREEVLWFDAEGRLLHREQQLFGATLNWNRCVYDCDAPIEKPYDVMSKLIVQSPYRIPEAAFTGSIRYVISRADGKPPHMPTTAEQAVVVDGSKLIVTVCTGCEVAEALSRTDLERYLRPNAWVQSDAPEIREFASRHGGGSTQIDIMNRLVDAVRDHMDGGLVDYLGSASALDALRTRSGDCIEYAVLLGAVARAKHIPTRIVYGLVYADRFSGKKEVFSPHAWVQAWTGRRWQSFDAGIGQFDATHLALRIGDGEPFEADDGFMTPADVRIENLGRVR